MTQEIAVGCRGIGGIDYQWILDSVRGGYVGSRGIDNEHPFF